ncbi:uncharacterized protein [Hemitrygon akajei]|uniref:uncharacterized protein isoform X2 n=1 Tax=Hemitrygon akajei TaxID=2704970 RepID=UPI003BF9F1BC
MPGKRKKKRCLRCCAQEPVDGMNVHRSPDCMEVLTTKYKVLNRSLPASTKNQNTVNEIFPQQLLPGVLGQRNGMGQDHHDAFIMKQMCLDPYDGDLESTSSEPDVDRQFMQDVCSEETSYLSRTIVTVKPYKQSLLTTFLPAHSYTELNSMQMETVATDGMAPQSSRESELLSNRVHELTLAIDGSVTDPGQQQFAPLELDVLTESSTFNMNGERDHRLLNVFVLQDPGKHDFRCQNVHLCSEQLLNAAQESFLEKRVSSKRKFGSPLIEASNDWIIKKKSRTIKTEVSSSVLK